MRLAKNIMYLAKMEKLGLHLFLETNRKLCYMIHMTVLLAGVKWLCRREKENTTIRVKNLKVHKLYQMCGVILMEVKITRKLLRNYQKYKREILFLKAELVEMLTTDAGIGNSVILDYQKGYPRPQSVVGVDYDLYEHRKGVLEHRETQVKAVEQWINAIEDGQVRCVFRMRYINGMSWTKIAEKTGYGGRADYVRLHIRDMYLKKCKIK